MKTYKECQKTSCKNCEEKNCYCKHPCYEPDNKVYNSTKKSIKTKKKEEDEIIE